MNKRLIITLIIVLLAIIMVVVFSWGHDGKRNQSNKVDLYVLAAASLTDAMQDIEQTYEATHPHINLLISYAASGKLQQQISEGARADAYLSASVKYMDRLEDQDRLINRAPILKNRMILIANQDTPKVKNLHDLASSNVGNITIGYPDTVPAGKYAKQILTDRHLWESLKSKMVFGNDVRQVLAYVETGNAEAGLVYQTDLQAAGQTVKKVAVINEAFHQPIIYPAGMIKGTEHLQQTKTFFHWLQTADAMKIFKSYQFTPYSQERAQ
ncbi:molybdate ABC transporter substrate-binding protein [Tuberibacillus sp. Marseille-P3662]|uniref:molybdate ABC transporter substrate-binding protein n=1 Tax=Tuberibacillus sp. Marseille-P3662 TaxID=1965358 RepID=UPI0015946E83|nr:molybdate ABC transporter substrate-binding protein [Tuberibacillus sp. Marseille-P3662]